MRYWKRIKPDGSTYTVESYSHDLIVEGAIEITEADFNAFLASLPKPPPPVDWKAEWAKVKPKTAEERIAFLAKRLELE